MEYRLNGRAARRSYYIEEFTIDNADGSIYGQLLVPETASAARPVPAVICSHYFGGTFRDAREWAAPFAEAGYLGVVFDFRGGGHSSRSTGTMAEMSVATELADLQAVMDEVCSREMVNAQMLFLEGQSLGGFVSALAAAAQPERVRGLMLLYPAFALPERIRSMFPEGTEVPESFELLGLEVGAGYAEAVRAMDAYSACAAYGGPVAIYHGDHDEIVPRSAIEQAVAAYPQVEFHDMKSAGHGFYGLMAEQIARELVDFVALACGERTLAEREREARKGKLWQGLGRRDLRKLWE